MFLIRQFKVNKTKQKFKKGNTYILLLATPPPPSPNQHFFGSFWRRSFIPASIVAATSNKLCNFLWYEKVLPSLSISQNSGVYEAVNNGSFSSFFTSLLSRLPTSVSNFPNWAAFLVVSLPSHRSWSLSFNFFFYLFFLIPLSPFWASDKNCMTQIWKTVMIKKRWLFLFYLLFWILPLKKK